MSVNTYECGLRGCAGMTKRRGTLRHCAQRAVVERDGKGYCYYHDPRHPKKFGERMGHEVHPRAVVQMTTANDNGNRPPLHIRFYELVRADDESRFRNQCPVCTDGLLLMHRANGVAGELLPHDVCTLCGQHVIYDDIDEVRRKGGW